MNGKNLCNVKSLTIKNQKEKKVVQRKRENQKLASDSRKLKRDEQLAAKRAAPVHQQVLRGYFCSQ